MRIRGFIGMSLDGHIADRDGGIGWLDPFQTVDYGFDRFIAGIGTVVMGRATFDQSLTFPDGWPFATKRTFVITSRPIADPPPGVEAWTTGVPTLIAALRETEDTADAWVVGGAKLQTAFIEADALDALDAFVIPVLLGDGIRLFPPSGKRAALTLISSEVLDKGMVRLSYSFRP